MGHVLAVVVGMLGLHQLHLLDERRLLELPDESSERLDVDGVADEADMDRITRDHGAERLALLLARCRTVGWGNRRDGRHRLLGLPQTGEAERDDPRVWRQGLAHLVHDVRPNEAIVVDGTNEVERSEHRIALRLGLVVLLQHRRIAGGILHRLLQGGLHPILRACLPSIQSGDGRDGDERHADRADEPRFLYALANGRDRRGDVDRRATTAPGTATRPGKQIDLDHRVTILMRPGAMPARSAA